MIIKCSCEPETLFSAKTQSVLILEYAMMIREFANNTHRETRMASMKSMTPIPLRMKLPSPQVLIALFSIYFIWGATDLGNKFALESYPPFLLVGLRLLLAMSILLAFLRIRGAPFPPMRQMLNALLIGGLMFGGRAGLFALAQQQGLGRGILSLGIATVPLWAIMFAILLGYRPGKLEIAGLIIGIVGIAILNIENNLQFDIFGVLILLFAPMTWAFGSIYSNHIVIPDGFMGTAFQMIGGCITLFVMSFLRGEAFPINPSFNATVALIVLSVFGTLVAFTAYMYLIQTVSAGLATSYSYVNPIVTIGLGAILLGDTFPASGMLALIVISIGVVLIMFSKSQFAEEVE